MLASWSVEWITTSCAPALGAERYSPPSGLGAAGGPAKAGNLLGTTRTFQPGLSAALPGSRSAQTSGGGDRGQAPAERVLAQLARGGQRGRRREVDGCDADRGCWRA